MELFDSSRQGLDFIFRYGHVVSGVAWIGLLWFFNFVQTPAYAELSDGARSEALRKLTLRALWWFRWAAMSTFLFGLALVFVKENLGDYFETGTGYAITTGMLFGVTMFLNVWFVIWPNQKVVIASAEAVAGGGSANPEAPAAAKAAGRASRCNTFFSATMLWFMIYAVHHPGAQRAEDLTNKGVYMAILLILWLFIELNAIGKLGGYDSAFNKLVFDKHRNTMVAGFGLLAFVYIALYELMLLN